jgi:hypothetical protein
MTPATVVKAADAAQFLAFIPRMLGYLPSESVVVIPFHDGRSLGAMRFDLPAGGAVDATAATVIGLVCRLPEVNSVAAIVYTGALFDGEGRMPHRTLLDALYRRADACGLGVTDLLCVAGDAWGSALDVGCPSSGRPLGDLQGVPPALAGFPAPDGDQTTGAALPPCSLEQKESIATALDALNCAIAVLCGPDAVGNRATAHRTPSETHAARIDPRALGTACRLDDLTGMFEEALVAPPAGRDAYDSAALIWCLARPSLRDVALVQWSGDAAQGDEALDAQLRWESGADYPSHLAMRMWGEGDGPDVARLECALEVARHAASVAPRAWQPGCLAMCAWLSWALGRSTHAETYATRALEIEPEHGLSEIVLSFVRAGHLPDWAFRRS